MSTGIPSLDKAVNLLLQRGWHVHQLGHEVTVTSRSFRIGVSQSRMAFEVELALSDDDVPFDELLTIVENQEIGEIVRTRPDLMAEVENELALRALARLGTSS